jgi:hypothetical protein
MKTEARPWYADTFKGAEVHVIKRRARKDRYFYEIVRPGKPTLKWNPGISGEIGDCPDLEDTWHSGKVDGQMFDLNVTDAYVFGTSDTAMGADFYEVSGRGTPDDPYEPNLDELVSVPVKCFLEDRAGNRRPFPCGKADGDFLCNFGEADPNE